MLRYVQNDTIQTLNLSTTNTNVKGINHNPFIPRLNKSHNGCPKTT